MEKDRVIVSRRTRPAKAPLSRAAIVSAALDILAREGLDGLSLRRVAAALDTGPASLYVYFANLQELHALMLDDALAAVALPAGRRGAWRERLKSVLRRYLEVLHARPGLAQVAMSTIASGPSSLRIWETLLGLMDEGGVEPAKAAWGVDLLILYVTAIAAEQSLRSTRGDELKRVEAVLAEIKPEEFPLVCAARKALMSGGDGSKRGEWALDVIIDGLAGPPQPKR